MKIDNGSDNQTDRVILELVCKGRLLALLASLEPLDEPFPDVDEDLASLDGVNP